MDFVECPPGGFAMGSIAPSGFYGIADGGELGRNRDEVLHSVILSKPFYIGKFPVTQKQYESIMGTNPSCFKGESNPVDCVSWNEARAFLVKINAKYQNDLPKGYKFDLPTESQWEYACRAGTITALNNGTDLTSEMYCNNLDEVAWYYRNSGNKTHPVGQKKPNAWGIYDMHGNVWEWCYDMYDKYPNPLMTVTDPIGFCNILKRVLRGGSWENLASMCRSACRNSNAPDYGFNSTGFRLAMVSKVR